MIKKVWLAAFLFFAIQALNALDTGELAPEFTAIDTHGHKHSLEQYQGKYVVLEWTNRDCSYVQNQYRAEIMQKLQKYWTARDVIWLTVISSAPGEQGYVTGRQEDEYLRQVGAAPTAVLLDPSGELGHLYEATSTPEMFVISPGGKLIYHGAIDNRPKVGFDGIPGNLNYVEQALEQSLAGQSVETPNTRAYGYSIKYAE